MPRGKAVMDLKSEARRFTKLGLGTLVSIARNGKAEPARVAAAIHLLDRGWGKADQNHSVDGAIEVTIRHIIEGVDSPRCIDADTTEQVDTLADASHVLPDKDDK